MTMNVAGALALVLCLTVTSSLSSTTETSNKVEFEKHEITLVKSSYEETVTVEAEENIIETTEAEEATEVVEATETEYENRWDIRLTDEEIELLAKIVWVEARGESVTGQQAVVEVIFNRIISDEFPNTLYDVLSQKNPVQFSSWKLRDTATPTEKEYESIYAVLNGETSLLREDTIFFATKKLTSDLDVQIGGHYFCY